MPDAPVHTPSDKPVGALRALEDAAALKADSGSSEEVYKHLMKDVQAANEAKGSGEQGTQQYMAYMQTLTQTLNSKKGGILPDLVINYLNDKGPKTANGDILLKDSKDGNDLTKVKSDLVTNTDPATALDRAFLGLAIKDFNALAGRVDDHDNNAKISANDLKPAPKSPVKP